MTVRYQLEPGSDCRPLHPADGGSPRAEAQRLVLGLASSKPSVGFVRKELLFLSQITHNFCSSQYVDPSSACLLSTKDETGAAGGAQVFDACRPGPRADSCLSYCMQQAHLLGFTSTSVLLSFFELGSHFECLFPAFSSFRMLLFVLRSSILLL